jgi:hypothetical protein
MRSHRFPTICEEEEEMPEFCPSPNPLPELVQDAVRAHPKAD